MVNYCCVPGCGRNSKYNNNLYFHAAPKDRERQKQWFAAADRLDVLQKPAWKRSPYRFCSRHFSPVCIKNKHLLDNAVPTLFLPGDTDTEDEAEETIHHDIVCNNCSAKIVGFRYKCLICDDYDLCSACESKDVHPEHFMLRIPTPVKYAKLKTVIDKWHKYHKLANSIHDSSDDEPITKYKSYDSGVDLSEEVKLSIRRSINRAFDNQPQVPNKKKKLKTYSKKRSSETEKVTKKQKVGVEEELKIPELAFADVNQIPSVSAVQFNEVKTEEFVSNDGALRALKLSDDLGLLYVEPNSQK